MFLLFVNIISLDMRLYAFRYFKIILPKLILNELACLFLAFHRFGV